MFAVGDVVQNETIGSLRLHPSIMNTNTSLSDYYCVEKDGRTVKLKAPQLTTQVLSKIFGLFPESILLLSEDGYVKTPDTDGRFTGVDDLPRLDSERGLDETSVSVSGWDVIFQ